MHLESNETSSNAPKPSILDESIASMATWLQDRSLPKYRAKQILGWVYQRRAESFEAMTDLPKGLRSELDAAFDFYRTKTIATQHSEDGTQKLLLQLPDGGRIECVLLRDGPRRSICVSSQVGCAMGCVFCASGLDGVERNLTRGEILDALSVAKDSEIGLGISPRRITISTVGLPQSIDKLAEDKSPYHLAISLHAPNDTLRNQLVPVNKKIGIESILEAADRYFDATGRRLTFEYVLLKDLNDSQQCAEQLVKLLRGRTAMLNVIPYNPVPGLPYETPTAEMIHQFRRILMEAGINVMFRQRKGDDIQAACGQLRRLREKEPDLVELKR
jgi:23S rRNA (adenine2503-C2)-methyltransferase